MAGIFTKKNSLLAARPGFEPGPQGYENILKNEGVDLQPLKFQKIEINRF